MSTRCVALMMTLLAPPACAQMDFNPKEFARNIPGMIRSNLKTFRVGTSTMWKNWGVAREIQRSALADASGLSYSDLVLVRKSKEDTNKFAQVSSGWPCLSFSRRCSTSTRAASHPRLKVSKAVASASTRWCARHKVGT